MRKGQTYAPPTPPSPASSPIPSASYRRLADVLILLVRLGSRCLNISLSCLCSFFDDNDDDDDGRRRGGGDVRCGIGVVEDISVLEVLSFGAHLEVFF